MQMKMETYYFAIRNKNDAFAVETSEVNDHPLLFHQSVECVHAYHVVAGVAVE